MTLPSDYEIRAMRYEIQRKRSVNNVTFMDWWEMSMRCPHCREAAMKYQGKIRKVDLEICEENRPVCA